MLVQRHTDCSHSPVSTASCATTCRLFTTLAQNLGDFGNDLPLKSSPAMLLRIHHAPLLLSAFFIFKPRVGAGSCPQSPSPTALPPLSSPPLVHTARQGCRSRLCLYCHLQLHLSPRRGGRLTHLFPAALCRDTASAPFSSPPRG